MIEVAYRVEEFFQSRFTPCGLRDCCCRLRNTRWRFVKFSRGRVGHRPPLAHELRTRDRVGLANGGGRGLLSTISLANFHWLARVAHGGEAGGVPGLSVKSHPDANPPFRKVASSLKISWISNRNPQSFQIYSHTNNFWEQKPCQDYQSQNSIRSMFAHTARRLGHRALFAAAHRCQPSTLGNVDGLARLGYQETNSDLGAASSALTSGINYMSTRGRHTLPYNTVVVFVPHQEAWVVERMGKYHKILEPGLNILFPFIDRVRYVQSLKEMAFEVVPQSAITADNVTLTIDGVLYLKVFDAYSASYNIENPEFSVTQLAITTMRSEIGKIQLDSVFRERESLNRIIVTAINEATRPWGISCLRYEIRDIKVPTRVQDAMQLQVEAERRRRARILESEGTRDAEINVANGEATAIMARAKAKANALNSVSNAIKPDAAAFLIAEQYVKAFSNLARTNTTLILPSDASDINKMVAQAFQVYKTMSKSPTGGSPPPGDKGAMENLDSVEGDGYLKEIEEALHERSAALPPTTSKTKLGSKQRRQ